MNKELLQERKKMIYDFICDELYVPMKAKEMAIVLNVPKSQRGELLEVLDALTADGKVEISGRGKYVKSEGKNCTAFYICSSAKGDTALPRYSTTDPDLHRPGSTDQSVE